jgi:exopolyphosphatase/pppGpp-phosphohydrolase
MFSMEIPLAARAGSTMIGVLELGTNSLKLHLSKDDLDPSDPRRVEWDLGYEVYSSFRISDETIGKILAQVHALLAENRVLSDRVPMVAIATGAFKEAHEDDIETLRLRFYQEEAIPLRILTGVEESFLLMEGARDKVTERPGLAFDLGGGSLDMVYFGRSGSCLPGHHPLGPIRIHHRTHLGSGAWDETQARICIDAVLRDVCPLQLPTIHGTGGTVKAIARVAGTDSIPYQVLCDLEEEARRKGAPRTLSNRRRLLFLPGLLTVRRLAEHTGAKVLRHTRVDLGEVLLARLRPFRAALRDPLNRTILFQHLEIFRTAPRTGAREGSGDGDPGMVV